MVKFLEIIEKVAQQHLTVGVSEVHTLADGMVKFSNMEQKLKAVGSELYQLLFNNNGSTPGGPEAEEASGQ